MRVMDLVEPGVIITTLLSIAAICVILNQVITFWKTHMRVQPDPALTYEKKGVAQELVDGLRKENQETFKEIFRDNKKISESLSAVSSKVDMINQSQVLQDQKLDNILKRLANDRR